MDRGEGGRDNNKLITVIATKFNPSVIKLNICIR